MAYLPLEDLHFFPSKRDLSDDVNFVSFYSLELCLTDALVQAQLCPGWYSSSRRRNPGILHFYFFGALEASWDVRVVFIDHGWFRPHRTCSLLTVLHLTVVTAFIASIIDLSQVLQREQSKRELGPQTDSLVKTREIGYALSNSLRFLFFWMFVAEPPKAERDTPNARAGTHSGNWDAWGIVGLALRWGSLCLTIIVFALQVVWRLDSRVDEFTGAYLAESAIEVILSIILAFKILLNCSHCTIVSKGVCLLDYLGFLLSLNLSIGLGIANIVHRESLSGFIRDMHGDE
jgi:hypothetical protein